MVSTYLQKNMVVWFDGFEREKFASLLKLCLLSFSVSILFDDKILLRVMFCLSPSSFLDTYVSKSELPI